jgi:hypothetical protein
MTFNNFEIKQKNDKNQEIDMLLVFLTLISQFFSNYLYKKGKTKETKGAICTSVSKLNRNTSPTKTIFLVIGCFSVVPPAIMRELLTFTQANSICESGFGIGGSCFHVISSSSM